MELEGAPQFASIQAGILQLIPKTLPLDTCTQFYIEHKALPDSSLQSQALTIKVKKDRSARDIDNARWKATVILAKPYFR